MSKTWDPSSILRGRIIAALFVMTATLAGAQALGPSMASAERVNCSNEEDREACEEGSPSGGTDDGTTDPGAPSAPDSGQSPSGGADVSSGGASAPAVPTTDSTTTQPDLRALDPLYISQLEHEGLIAPKLLKISSSPGDLSALTDDCQQLSFTMNALDTRRDSLEQLIHVLDPGPARAHLRRRLSDNRYAREFSGTEFHDLSCGAVLSLDGRD